MDFFLGILFGIAIGFFWGVWRATQSFIQRIVDKPEEIREIMSRVQQLSKEDNITTPSTDTPNDIKIEHHQGVVYLYDNNNEFLAQGNSISDALTVAKQRFPDRKFAYRVNLPEESNQ
jgi:MFS superfamily sulfate permease-like transporter